MQIKFFILFYLFLFFIEVIITNESIELTDEQQETKDFIRFIVKLILYVPFFMILFIVVQLIIKGFTKGFI